MLTMNTRRRFLFTLPVLCLLGLTACTTSVGPGTVPTARFDYNQAVAQSWDEQLLLNLVRLRYRDTLQFLEVTSVLTQYRVAGSASVSGNFPWGPGGESTAAGVGVNYSEAPTISYAPLQGEDFVRSLLTPISPTTLALMSQSGWSIERLVLCCVHQINELRNSPSAAGPTPIYVPRYQELHQVATSLRALQLAGALTVEAALDENGAEELRLRIKDVGNLGNAAAAIELFRHLGLNPERTDYRIVARSLRRDDGEIAVVGRSLLAVLFFLSHGVEAPAEHRDAGWVTVTKNPDGSDFDWSLVTGPLLEVHSSASRPENAFTKVRYRDHWFYIDDSDLNSKTTFNLLSYLFSLQSAGSTSSPLLTVSAGG